MTPFYFAILLLCTMCFGSVIGAYFGTAEYRIRNCQKLITASCYCPSCRHSLSLYHQIPVISWIFLRGKCHYCNSPIPIRYPLIESGFLLYYSVTFVLLWKHPFLLPFLWMGFVVLLLLLRCPLNRMFGKGLLIFAVYHAVYCLILQIILSALGNT